MLIERTIQLPCTPQRCFAEVQTPRLLPHVASPLVRFVPVEPKSLPEYWGERQYLVKIHLFGFLPFGQQWVNISRRDRSNEMGQLYFELRDNGRGSLISRWDHLITIRPSGNGCSYPDRVEVRAGALTQRRWQQLVTTGFAYGQP